MKLVHSLEVDLVSLCNQSWCARCSRDRCRFHNEQRKTATIRQHRLGASILWHHPSVCGFLLRGLETGGNQMISHTQNFMAVFYLKWDQIGQRGHEGLVDWSSDKQFKEIVASFHVDCQLSAFLQPLIVLPAGQAAECRFLALPNWPLSMVCKKKTKMLKVVYGLIYQNISQSILWVIPGALSLLVCRFVSHGEPPYHATLL